MAERGWVSVSDLAEYAYCPRAHWYSHHRPSVRLSRASRERFAAGRRFHTRALRRERRDESVGNRWRIALAVGMLLLAAAGTLAYGVL